MSDTSQVRITQVGQAGGKAIFLTDDELQTTLAAVMYHQHNPKLIAKLAKELMHRFALLTQIEPAWVQEMLPKPEGRRHSQHSQYGQYDQVSAGEQFHLLMNEVTDYAIFFADKDATVITWNAGAERILGWTESEIIGQDLNIIFTPEDRQEGNDQEEIRTAAKAGRANDERWHLHKDGSRFWASGILTSLKDDDGNLRGYCKILRDLTERKQWEEALKADHEKQARVLDVLQQSLLMTPLPEAFPGLTVKPLYLSATDDALVGGDFYDIFAIEEDRVALVVGDATGHGIEAVTYTAEVKFALRLILRESKHTGEALRRLNDFVADRERLDSKHLGTSYVALAVCIMNTRKRELVCSWGGIEPPFVLRAATGNVLELMECHGPLLGVEKGAEYTQQLVQMAEGDVLVMTSDGLTEARRVNGKRREMFGFDGLVQAVREEVARNPDSLGSAANAVVRRVHDFAGGKINDDVCLLMTRCIEPVGVAG